MSIEVLLIDENNPIATKAMNTFKRLQNNEGLIKRYEELKVTSNGLSIREYKRRRLEFFNYVDSL